MGSQKMTNYAPDIHVDRDCKTGKYSSSSTTSLVFLANPHAVHRNRCKYYAR